MGADVGAYKTWNKEEIEYFKPILETKINISSQDTRNLYKFLYKHYNHGLSSYILDYVGYYVDCTYSDADVQRYINKANKLKEIILSHEELTELYSPLVKAIDEGYALARTLNLEDKEYQIYAFNKLESYPKMLWSYDDYVDVEKFPNREIPQAFELVNDTFNIDLYPFIIDVTEYEYIDDKKVNHNVHEAIELANKVIQLNTDNIDLYKTISLNDVLNQCLKIWEQGGKITVSY